MNTTEVNNIATEKGWWNNVKHQVVQFHLQWDILDKASYSQTQVSLPRPFRTPFCLEIGPCEPRRWRQKVPNVGEDEDAGKLDRRFNMSSNYVRWFELKGCNQKDHLTIIE